MTAKTPIFRLPEAQPQHFPDYGFDPPIGYFQALHEARKHGKREAAAAARPLDACRFRLPKPISKDEARRTSKGKKRGRWWRGALLFWRRKGNDQASSRRHETPQPPSSSPCYPRHLYLRAPWSSPVYMTESGGGGWAAPPRRRSGGGWGGGLLRLSGPRETEMPYLCLRDLAAVEAPSAPSPSPAPAARPPALPVYLVT